MRQEMRLNQELATTDLSVVLSSPEEAVHIIHEH
jgi:hypothetical protein